MTDITAAKLKAIYMDDDIDIESAWQMAIAIIFSGEFAEECEKDVLRWRNIVDQIEESFDIWQQMIPVVCSPSLLLLAQLEYPHLGYAEAFMKYCFFYTKKFSSPLYAAIYMEACARIIEMRGHLELAHFLRNGFVELPESDSIH